ncbi:MAG: glycosyltransferase, partial [Solirubrobacteraceae bacterium]
MDLSVVIPTHNGSRWLAPTLAHVAAQRPPAELEWEVILVDNASTDHTAASARAAWPRDAPVALRVVDEPRLGLGHAHLRGFAEARGEIVTWVEDDNRVAPDRVEIAWRVMAEHPEAGACAGFNAPAPELTPPEWFHRFAHAYATGPQGEAGDVTESRGHLWGAGLTIRRAAWDHLSRHGFAALLPDRRGATSFNSGGDTEICLALRMAGWRLRYEPRLRLEHLIVAHRLDWGYLRGLSRGVGASSVGFDPYRRALRASGAQATRGAWLAEARRAAGGLARGGLRPWRE